MFTLLRRMALVLLASGGISISAMGAVLCAQPDAVAVDRSAVGTWQAIQKLQTFASVLHTTTDPDDEHGRLLTWLSRGLGAHVSLLTLTRGEAATTLSAPRCSMPWA